MKKKILDFFMHYLMIFVFVFTIIVLYVSLEKTGISMFFNILIQAFFISAANLVLEARQKLELTLKEMRKK